MNRAAVSVLQLVVDQRCLSVRNTNVTAKRTAVMEVTSWAVVRFINVILFVKYRDQLSRTTML